MASTDFQRIQEILDVRNKIVHELDIHLEGERRKRNIRSKKTLVCDANMLLEAGEQMLRAVEVRLRELEAQ